MRILHHTLPVTMYGHTLRVPYLTVNMPKMVKKKKKNMADMSLGYSINLTTMRDMTEENIQ
jgi:hypothetical protein